MPKRVRVYDRDGRYLLNYWDPAARKNVTEKIAGDLLAAISAARLAEEKIIGRPKELFSSKTLSHELLVLEFLADLGRRADAGEVRNTTPPRYRSALGHYLTFVGLPEVAREFPLPTDLNRDFRLRFDAWLSSRRISPNGHPASDLKPLRGIGFIRDTMRAMLEWASDPDRGHRLPEGFRNPFLRSGRRDGVFRGDPLTEPDITLRMTMDFVQACDSFQLRLFVPLILFGLRASEPCWLFREHLEDHWLKVPCLPELEYLTKGRADKRFPLPAILSPFWRWIGNPDSPGFLNVRREQGTDQKFGLIDLAKRFQDECARVSAETASAKTGVRNRLVREAGGLTYDTVQGEFRRIARRLGWPSEATLKDFRHSFATMLARSGMAEPYRQYLMGHAPSTAAIHAYTHLADMPAMFADAISTQWGSLAEAINLRARAVPKMV